MRKVMPITSTLSLAILAVAPGVHAQVTSNQTSVVADSTSIRQALNSNFTEVGLGRVAESRAEDDAVEDFAERMISEHGSIYESWEALAEKINMETDIDLEQAQEPSVVRLRNLSGTEFDQAYMTEMIQLHEQDLAAFQRMGTLARSYEVRQLASSPPGSAARAGRSTTLLNARLIATIDRLVRPPRAFWRPERLPRLSWWCAATARWSPRLSPATVPSRPSSPARPPAWSAPATSPAFPAMVSDIGGTTTDVAVLENGRPRLDPEGATVGGWRTMVEAVAMRTFGLGGDSEVALEEGGLDLAAYTLGRAGWCRWRSLACSRPIVTPSWTGSCARPIPAVWTAALRCAPACPTGWLRACRPRSAAPRCIGLTLALDKLLPHRPGRHA